MSDAIFLPDDFTETLEIEAKLVQGREARTRADRGVGDVMKLSATVFVAKFPEIWNELPQPCSVGFLAWFSTC